MNKRMSLDTRRRVSTLRGKIKLFRGPLWQRVQQAISLSNNKNKKNNTNYSLFCSLIVVETLGSYFCIDAWMSDASYQALLLILRLAWYYIDRSLLHPFILSNKQRNYKLKTTTMSVSAISDQAINSDRRHKYNHFSHCFTFTSVSPLIINSVLTDCYQK